MSGNSNIPIFPLALLPLPGEHVPLHIFEPRYRQLLQDAETSNLSFGIFCNHEMNTQRLGSLMTLDRVIKRYPGGESDIVVVCSDVFSMGRMTRNFGDRLYPGGDTSPWHIDVTLEPTREVSQLYLEFQRRRDYPETEPENIYQVATALSLDIFERYAFLTASHHRKMSFLQGHLRFEIYLMKQAELSRDHYHLN